ncbi:hypothetical protein ACSS6W_006140 [Trichoderma asperelloides]
MARSCEKLAFKKGMNKYLGNKINVFKEPRALYSRRLSKIEVLHCRIKFLTLRHSQTIRL